MIQQGYNCVSGLNLVGLRRAGFSSRGRSPRSAWLSAILYKEGRTLTGALEIIEADLGQVSEITEFVGFIRSSKIGVSPARDPGRNRRAE